MLKIHKINRKLTCLNRFSHPGQKEVHLKFSHPPTETRPDPESEGHRPERVMLGLVVCSPEPALREEGVRVGENVLVVGHGVVAQVEESLREKERSEMALR